jgi:hypothetical protein
LACYESATFNTGSCSWDVTGSKPAAPTVLCYQTATWNGTTCQYDVIGTQPPAIITTVTTCGSYTWSVSGVSYTQSGTYNFNVDCQDYTLNLTINLCQSVVTVKMNIQGFTLPNGMMRPVLENQGVGSSTTNVDNVTIELHNTSEPFATFAATTAMLQTNGDAVATFSSAPVGSFYIVVKHRNSVETWSANPVTIGTSSSYDFTDSATKAYGGNMILVGGKYAIYNGDINQDGAVESLDYDQLNLDNDNFESGFFATDLNGDGSVESLDYDILNLNNDNFVGTVRP